MESEGLLGDLGDHQNLLHQNDSLQNSRLSRIYVQANVEKDKLLQKLVNLVKVKDNAQIARLPAPWREKFNSLSLDKNNLLYLDERLIIPKGMRENMLTALHFGHAGRGSEYCISIIF